MSLYRASKLLGTREVMAALAVSGGLLAIALVVSVFGSKATQAIAANGFVLLTLVIGLSVFVGSTGVLSFGHAGFAAVAGYVTALLTVPPVLKNRLLPALPVWLADTNLPVPLSIAAAVVVATIIGTLAGLAIVRLSGAAATIATLGLLIIANSVLIGAVDYTRGAQAIYGIPPSIGVWSAALVAIACYCVARAFKDSTYGLMARASRDNEAAARSIGIAAHKARLAPWIVSVAIVALGGALLAHRLTVISPKEFYFSQSFEWLVVVIVGGMLTVSGNVAGAIAIVCLVEFLRRLEEGVTLLGMTTPQLFGLTDAGLGIAILLALVKRGSGIAGGMEFDQWRAFQPWQPMTAVLAADDQAPSPRQHASDKPATLYIDGISKNYGGVQALSGVTFGVRTGRIVGLIGPNGSGKSTLLACVSRAIEPTSGRVMLDKLDVTDLQPQDVVRHGIARTFQNIRVFGNLTVAENIEAALIGSGQARGRYESRARALTIMKQSGLTHLAERGATTLSYGDQRRLEIARALACNTSFLLLDEPAAGMNEKESAALAGLLRAIRDETGVGILVVEHDLSLVLSLCDEIVVLEKGEKIALGTPDDIKRNQRVAAAYLGRRPASLPAQSPELLS